MTENQISSKLVASAIEVHRILGPGLLESAYRECLCYELRLSGLQVEKEKPMPVTYKGISFDHGYRMDLLIEKKVVVEIKTVEELSSVHFSQLLTYLRLGDYRLGLLINFQESLLKNGLRRIVNQLRDESDRQ